MSIILGSLFMIAIVTLVPVGTFVVGLLVWDYFNDDNYGSGNK